ncbi:hypothetical protein BDV19DRAFT_371025, partial [Aspergillus venezuelensis]
MPPIRPLITIRIILTVLQLRLLEVTRGRVPARRIVVVGVVASLVEGAIALARARAALV